MNMLCKKIYTMMLYISITVDDHLMVHIENMLWEIRDVCERGANDLKHFEEFSMT